MCCYSVLTMSKTSLVFVVYPQKCVFRYQFHLYNELLWDTSKLNTIMLQFSTTVTTSYVISRTHKEFLRLSNLLDQLTHNTHNLTRTSIHQVSCVNVWIRLAYFFGRSEPKRTCYQTCSRPMPTTTSNVCSISKRHNISHSHTLLTLTVQRQ